MSGATTLLELVEEHLGEEAEMKAFNDVEEAARDLLAEYEAVVARLDGANMPAAQALTHALLNLDRARLRTS